MLDTQASRLRQRIVSAGGPRIVSAVRGSVTVWLCGTYPTISESWL